MLLLIVCFIVYTLWNACAVKQISVESTDMIIKILVA